MAGGLSNLFGSHDDDRFLSLMHMFDENKQPVHNRIPSFPVWVEKYCDYSHTKHTQTGVHDLSNTDLDIQRKMGVLINTGFSVDGKHSNQLAQYCAFKSLKELSSYVDIIGKR
ncbi:hypothetical protein FNYG_11647 [Fusarium nygamai]|uniref:Uncharacterized protein n=1 Tax=Gibberella nygamai TaxID=42673 RepID=A0A2K0VY87_GIBNY|nr:hypothetical protein FNYG_11647 [Fusarium nygamai]